jgi:hypothetical protein
LPAPKLSVSEQGTGSPSGDVELVFGDGVQRSKPVRRTRSPAFFAV